MLDRAQSAIVVDPRSAFSLANRAEEDFRHSNDLQPGVLIEIKLIKAKALIRLDEFHHAEDLVRSALALAAKHGSRASIKGDLILSLGRIQIRRDQVQDALANTQRAYQLFRAAGARRQQALALQGIAQLYVRAGDSKTALKYFAQSDDEYSGDAQMAMSLHNNRGKAFLDLSLPKDAELEFRGALARAQEVRSKNYLPIILSNIAQAEVNQGKLDQAEVSVQRAFALTRTQDDADASWSLWELRAQIAYLRKDIPSATHFIERALQGVDPATSASTYRQAHDTAYKIYRDAGKAMLALANLEALARIDEATAKLTASTSAALMAARFDFTNQNLKIAQLKAVELERSAQAQRNLFITIVIGGFLVLSLLIFGLILITRSRNRERAARLVLAQTNTELEKAIAAKMEFLATTSHEIRTPLNGILGMTQVMLSDRRLDAQLRDRIGIVHSAGENMRVLVDDILDVAKMETGKLSVNNGIFDLKATLREVAQVWRLQADAAGIGLTLDLDDCPDGIRGDSDRVRQIVFNLLSNAMKFTEKGAVALSVKTATHVTGSRVEIIVRDTGIGIDRSWHESIFELFQQVDGGTTRRYGGTGLGLAICRNLARAMGGDIRVESEVGFGSTFTIDLPLIESGSPESDTTDQPSTAERPASVLVIERNPLTRGVMRAILSARFATVAFVSSASEASDYLAHEKVSWIVADADSTEDFGVVLASTQAPIVLIEGTERVAEATRALLHTVLSKPLTKSMLLDAFGAAESSTIQETVAA